MARHLITGPGGQDGQFLIKELLADKQEVTVLLNELHNKSYQNFDYEIQVKKCNFRDKREVSKILGEVQPGYVYNFAGFSSVRKSFSEVRKCFEINYHWVEMLCSSILEAGSADTRLIHCSSSEMYAGLGETVTNEASPLSPVSPYGVSKASAHFLTQMFRAIYGVNLSNAILFNHESELRSEQFASKRIIKSVVDYYLGFNSKIQLNSIAATRDWGFAGDYVRAMRLMAESTDCEDFVIASGELYSVRDFAFEALKQLGIEAADAELFEEIPDKERKIDHQGRRGDSTKIRSKLNWTPNYTFEMLVGRMLKHELDSRSDSINESV